MASSRTILPSSMLPMPSLNTFSSSQSTPASYAIVTTMRAITMRIITQGRNSSRAKIPPGTNSSSSQGSSSPEGSSGSGGSGSSSLRLARTGRRLG
eukprot:564928-Prymnesium_polylepis.1